MVLNFIKFKKNRYSNTNTKEILTKVSKCKQEELENLLKQIEV